jgi:hypothetical protein
MSDVTPTLKIRLKMPDDHSHLGRDCHQVAGQICAENYTVLDAKWGRSPKHWSGAGDWGRASLTEREKGFLEAVEMVADEGTTAARLAAIIRRISR